MSNARNLSKIFSLSSVLGALMTIGQQGAEQPGIVKDFAGPENKVPAGYLLCDGSAVSRTTYAALFDAIGTTHGVGDGSTTFNLPDARGRVIAGADDMGGTSANRLTGGLTAGGGPLGTFGGVQTVTLTAAQSGMPAHAHTASSSFSGGSAASAGAHTHDLSSIGSGGAPATRVVASHNDVGGNPPTNVPGGALSAGAHTHTVTGSVSTTVNSASAVGASQAHNNVQPTLVLNKIIKT